MAKKKDITDITVKQAIDHPVRHKLNAFNEIKKRIFLDAFERNKGNCNATGRELGLSRISVYKYRAKWVFKSNQD